MSATPADEGEDRPYVFNTTLIIWPFVIGCAALELFTTSDGFSTVLSGGIGAHIVSLAMSALLVSVATLCSYYLGGALAHFFLGGRGDSRLGNRTLVPFVLGFLVTASLSGLFSYTFWHEKFYRLSAREIDAREQPRQLSSQIAMPGLMRDIDAQLKGEAAAILAAPDVKDWIEGQMGALSKAAGDGGESFQKALAAAAAKRLEEADRTKKEIATIESAIGAEQVDLDAIQTELQKPDAQPKLDAQTRIVKEEEQAAIAALGGADPTGLAGKGSIYKSHIAAQAKAQTRVNLLTKALKPLMDKAAELRQAIDAQKKLESQKQLALDSAGSGSAANVVAAGAALSDLPAAIGRFKQNPRATTANELVSVCRTVLGIVQSLGNPPEAAKIACALPPGGEGATLIGAHEAHMAAFDVWRQACDPALGADAAGSLEARIDAISRTLDAKTIDAEPTKALDAAREIVTECVDKAGAIGIGPSSQAAVYEKISNYVSEHSLGRNEFERSMEDLRALKPAAQAGLLVSAFIELAILIFKMLTDIVRAKLARAPAISRAPIDFRDRPDEPLPVRVNKAICRNLRAAGDHEDEILEADIEQVPEDLRASIQSEIRRLVHDRHARHREKDKAYRISHKAILEIERWLVEETPAARAPREPGAPVARIVHPAPPARGADAPASSPSPDETNSPPLTLAERMARNMRTRGDRQGG
jgi:hypothetical protein